jgi:hypothetical protein
MTHKVNKQRMMNILGEIVGVADILYVSTAANSNTANAQNGAITMTLGNAISGEVYYSECELWSSPGIISAPLLPAASTNNTDSAQVMYFNYNDQKIGFAVRDTRNMLQAGLIQPGETCVYAPGAQGRILIKLDSSINLVTTSDGTSSGQTVGIFVGTDTISIQNQYGAIMISSSGITITAGAAAVTLDANTGTASLLGQTANVQGAVASVSGSSATMIGPQATPAAPVLIGATPAPTNTALYGPTGEAGLPAPSVLLSTT